MRTWLALLGLCSCSTLVDLDELRSHGADDAATDASIVSEGGVCVPRTCESLGANCGPVTDGCGGIITKNGVESCGTCTGGLSCNAVKPNVCGSPPLYAGTHDENDCEMRVGQVRGIGIVGDAGGPQTLCELAGTACPSGWTRLANWGSTQAQSGSCGCDPQPCTTGSHAFANVARESCSTPCKSLFNGNCNVSAGSQTVTAKQVTVGCY